MAENLSAVQNCVELRISNPSSDSKTSVPVAVLAKIAMAAFGCAALASCANSPNAYSQNGTTMVAAAGPETAAVPVPLPPVKGREDLARNDADKANLGKNGTNKPYVANGTRYEPHADPHYTAVGLASWYGAGFHGRQTADGERFDMGGLTAAHKTMPLPSYARVTNMSNGASIVVRVNDRGPYVHGRLIDLSSRAADLLQFKNSGVGKVKVEYVGRAPDSPDDTRTLLATLRTDGTPAPMPSGAPGTMLAGAAVPVAAKILPVQTAQASVKAIPMPKVVPAQPFATVPSIVAQGDNSALPAPQMAALSFADTPLPPQRPRGADGILGRNALPRTSMASVGQVDLSKVKAKLPVAQQPSIAIATAPNAAPVFTPGPAIDASMVPGQ